MESNRLQKIDNFARHHLLVSSFVCLVTLSLVFNFYISFVSDYDVITTFSEFIDIIERLSFGTFVLSLYSAIPILVICSILVHFLGKETPTVPVLAYYEKFFLTFIPTLALILFFLIWITQDAILRYSKPIYLYYMAIFVSFVCSAIFATYFSWLSRDSKLGIIVQCIIANLLIGLLNGFMYALATWEIG